MLKNETWKQQRGEYDSIYSILIKTTCKHGGSVAFVSTGNNFSSKLTWEQAQKQGDFFFFLNMLKHKLIDGL